MAANADPMTRYSKCCALQTAARKLFSPAERLRVLHAQDYKCVGHYCGREVQMPAEFDLDHRIPLFEAGVLDRRYTPDDLAHLDRRDDGTYDLNSLSNMEALCTRCHRYKTSHEKTAFYKLERQAKYAAQADAIQFEPVTDLPPDVSPYFNEARATRAARTAALFKALDRFRYRPPPGLGRGFR